MLIVGFVSFVVRDVSELLADTARVPVQMALSKTPKPWQAGRPFERMLLWTRAGNYFRRQHLPVVNALPSTCMSPLPASASLVECGYDTEVPGSD